MKCIKTISFMFLIIQLSIGKDMVSSFRDLKELCSHLQTANRENIQHINILSFDEDPVNCSTQNSAFQENMKNIISINFSYANISSFPPHRNRTVFSNVEVLNLKGNQDFKISSIRNFVSVKRITKLDLSEVNIGIQNLQALKELLKSMPKLDHLSLTGTNLQEFRFDWLSQPQVLKYIALNLNPLTSIVFNAEVVTSLRYLYVTNCSLSEIGWSGEPSLPSKSNLRIVDFSSNQLTALPEFLVKLLSNARSLNIQDNKIDNNHCSFYYFWKMMFKNDIKNFKSDFSKKDLEKKPSLLSCSWHECPFYCTCFPNIKTVDCSNKGLTAIPEIGPSDTEILKFEGNRVKDIAAIFNEENWCNLEVINLNNNGMDYIDKRISYFPGKCKCPGKPDKTTCWLPNLQTLSLAWNKLVSFSFMEWSIFVKTKILNLSHNQLSANSFADNHFIKSYTEVQSLDLSFNHFKQFNRRELTLFPYVSSLNLSHNNIQYASSAMLMLAPYLKILDVSSNNLTENFPANFTKFFSHLGRKDPYATSYPRLTKILIKNNSLQFLNPTLWSHVQEISLSDNMWSCSQKSLLNMQLFVWRNMQPNVIKEFRSLKCANGLPMSDIKINSTEDNNIKIDEHESLMEFCERKFSILLIWTVVLFFLTIICGTRLRILYKILKNKINKRGFVENTTKYDVYVDYSPPDTERACDTIIQYLKDSGYRVAHPAGLMFMPGQLMSDEALKHLRQSKRMLSIISPTFFEDQQQLSYLNMGLTEEHNHCLDFRVAALVWEHMPELPLNLTPSLSHFFERIKIRYQDRDWKIRLRSFIGSPSRRVHNNNNQEDSARFGNINRGFSMDESVSHFRNIRPHCSRSFSSSSLQSESGVESLERHDQDMQATSF